CATESLGVRCAMRASLVSLALALAAVACGGRAAPPPAAQVPAASATEIAIDGDPNGLWWDAASGALLIADDDHGRILRWRDGEDVAVVATLPARDGAGLGQLVIDGTGAIIIARFGHGTAGEVLRVAADGTAQVVPGLDAERRRIG